MDRNTALLSGTVLTEPVFSHSVHGANLYTCALGVERLSGTVDRVNLLFSEALLAHMAGRITVRGQIRGYTRQDADKRRLLLMVLVREVSLDAPEDNNVISLRGELVRPVVFRRTPLGREIADLMVKVPRPYSGVDYIPCVVWGRCARFCAHLGRGTMLEAHGPPAEPRIRQGPGRRAGDAHGLRAVHRQAHGAVKAESKSEKNGFPVFFTFGELSHPGAEPQKLC